MINVIILKMVELYMLPDDDSKNILENDITITKNKINELREIYKGYYKDQIDKIEDTIIKHLWNEMNEKFIEPFANIKEGFSITTHKSQGSTFCNVFIDCHDIFKNRDNNVYMRCIYTALTRASNKVYILI